MESSALVDSDARFSSASLLVKRPESRSVVADYFKSLEIAAVLKEMFRSVLVRNG